MTVFLFFWKKIICSFLKNRSFDLFHSDNLDFVTYITSRAVDPWNMLLLRDDIWLSLRSRATTFTRPSKARSCSIVMRLKLISLRETKEILRGKKESEQNESKTMLEGRTGGNRSLDRLWGIAARIEEDLQPQKPIHSPESLIADNGDAIVRKVSVETRWAREQNSVPNLFGGTNMCEGPDPVSADWAICVIWLFLKSLQRCKKSRWKRNRDTQQSRWNRHSPWTFVAAIFCFEATGPLLQFARHFGDRKAG